MKPRQETGFSWNGLFIVTAVSFLSFSGITKIIGGSSSHSFLFLIIGVASLVLFTGSLIAGGVIKEPKKK